MSSPPPKMGTLLEFKRKPPPPSKIENPSADYNEDREPYLAFDVERAWAWSPEEEARRISVRHEQGGRRIHAVVADPEGSLTRLVLTPEMARKLAGSLVRAAHFAAQSADFTWRMQAQRVVVKEGLAADETRGAVRLIRCELAGRSWWEVERAGRRTFAIADPKKAERFYREAVGTAVRRCGAWPGMDFLSGYCPNRNKGCNRRHQHAGKHKSRLREWEQRE